VIGIISKLYFKGRFYLSLIGIIFVFLFSYGFPVIFPLAIILFSFNIILLIYDIFLLFSDRNGIEGNRTSSDRFSNGDENDIIIDLTNNYPFHVHLEIIDEIPFQFQKRDVNWKLRINAKEKSLLTYSLRPVKRGEYNFGALNVFASSPVGLCSRRYRFDNSKMVPVYPSYLQMKKFELVAFSQRLSELGIKKIRKLGHTMEFEQIKTYVTGDDPRTINWKATARKNELMVNQFQDEKSQRIYCIIDKGRMMRMPFDGLSLLDYAINATLVISNIAIKKHDKAGLLTFSNKMSSMIPAEKKPGQMRMIQQLLYSQRTRYLESNFELLNAFIQRRITQRSLLLLFTNFESFASFKRQVQYFKILSKRHLVVVIFFQNTGLKELINTQPQNMQEIYDQAIAEKFEYDKILIVKELQKHGILTILSTPKELTVNTINTYLEIKARGIL